jgi:hypothetical protein
LAALALEKGNSSTQVEHSVRELVNVFHAEKVINDKVTASALLARILFAQGRPKDSLPFAEAAITAAAKADQNCGLIATVTAEPIRLAAGSHNAAQAVSSLRKTVSDARKSGYVQIALEAMFALGEVEMKSGNVAKGRMQLRAVEQESRRRGLMALANKATLTAHRPTTDL